MYISLTLILALTAELVLTLVLTELSLLSNLGRITRTKRGFPFPESLFYYITLQELFDVGFFQSEMFLLIYTLEDNPNYHGSHTKAC